MTNLERRIRKLEARGNDPGGLVPYSSQWVEYWDRQMERYVGGESNVFLTLEGVCSWMQRTGSECEV
jgi:hypothetical protein